MRIQFILKCLFLVLMLTITQIFGQVRFVPEADFQLIFGNNFQNSLYQHFNNPAHLFEDWREEVLFIRSTLNESQGDFKPFIEPGKRFYFEQSVSGKKRIDSLQIFRGSFGVRKQIHADWQWVVTRDLRWGMPFLLGDSSRGTSRFNGIAMNAQYCRKIKKFQLGASLDYYVDEGLKKISPKPTSKHRDIAFQAGVQYQPDENWQFSALWLLVDNQEEIYYREDQSSFYKGTTLFKFRGYDLPLVLNKNTETRYGYFDEYGFIGAVKYHFQNGSSIVGFWENRLQQNEIKDNSVNPQNQGYWQNNIYAAGCEAQFLFSDGSLGMSYQYKTESSWARHPYYRTLFSETDLPGHKLGIGANYQWNSQISAGLELIADLQKMDYRDYYSDVNWSVEKIGWQQKAGLQIQWRPTLLTFFSLGAFKQYSSNQELSVESFSDFWKIRQADVLYYLAENTGYFADFEISFFIERLGFVQWYLQWQKILPSHDNFFRGKNRTQINTGLTFQIKAY